MSFSIPAQIEKDIIAGRAVYRTFQTGSGGQSILQVPPNSYAVIYGYDYSPAGGGLQLVQIVSDDLQLTDSRLRRFETQQISFFTGNDFFPFIHHFNSELDLIFNSVAVNQRAFVSIDNTPISRQVYITSTNDVTITVGLILRNGVATQNLIPITNRTPQALTYGGSAQAVNTQTDFGPLLTAQQFMQPSVKDYSDFAFGLLPPNADGQAFATPDSVNGLTDPSAFLNLLGTDFRDAAACNYYLNVHYALYTATIPEQRG